MDSETRAAIEGLRYRLESHERTMAWKIEQLQQAVAWVESWAPMFRHMQRFAREILVASNRFAEVEEPKDPTAP